MQISADRLQLTHDRLRALGVVEPFRGGFAQLDEALDRRPRRVTKLDRHGLEDLARASARASTRVRAPRSAGTSSTRCVGGRGQLLVGHRLDRVDRQPAQALEVEPHVVPRKAQLLEIGAHGRPREPLVAELGDRGERVTVPLRQLLAVLAEDEPVVDHLRERPAERGGDPPVHRLVRPMVRAADHVRDPELEIVDHGRELVGRGAVRTDERRPVEADRAVRDRVLAPPSSARSAAAA